MVLQNVPVSNDTSFASYSIERNNGGHWPGGKKPIYQTRSSTPRNSGKLTQTSQRPSLQHGSRILSRPSIPTVASASQSAADVSIPGMGKLFDSGYSKSGKLLWGLAITVSFVVCFIQISNRISQYLKEPISVNVEVVRNFSIRMPSLTICPFYPFLYSAEILEMKRKYALKFNVTYNTDNELSLKVRSVDLLDLPGINTSVLWNMATIGNLDASIICEFQSKTNCYGTMITEELATYHGMCTVFHIKGRIKYDGAHNGFRFFLEPKKNVKDSYWQSMIILHETNDKPRHQVYMQSGLVLHPTYQTSIQFQTKQYRRIDTSSNPCERRTKVQQCMWDCFEEYVMRSSSCRLPYITGGKWPLCTNGAEARNMQEATKDAYRRAEQREICTHCPRKCIENVYSMMQDVVKPHNITWFKLLLQDNTVEVVKEIHSFSFNALVSEVGGSLGLFLGICILTALQLVEIIVTHIKNKISNSEM